MHHELAVTANLLGEPARAAMLLKLMSGRALPAGELALAANISPQTASGHLAKLIEGRFVNVQAQGRHRYYCLAGAEVADAVEALLSLATGGRDALARKAVMPVHGSLAYARTCYAHLAGWVGVQIADALQRKGLLLPASGKAFVLTDSGCSWFQDLGIPESVCSDRTSTKVAKQCLDWTERRPHLAGLLGVAMYRRLLHLKWIASLPDTRAVRVTIEGKRALWRLLQIPIR
jgi:DNA-binding transcriptional ArsR family regulator